MVKDYKVVGRSEKEDFMVIHSAFSRETLGTLLVSTRLTVLDERLPAIVADRLSWNRDRCFPMCITSLNGPSGDRIHSLLSARQALYLIKSYRPSITPMGYSHLNLSVSVLPHSVLLYDN